jgi:hypothetical protein
MNKAGGKWVVVVRSAPARLDVAWLNVLMGLVGETIELDLAKEVCGVVVCHSIAFSPGPKQMRLFADFTSSKRR